MLTPDHRVNPNAQQQNQAQAEARAVQLLAQVSAQRIAVLLVDQGRLAFGQPLLIRVLSPITAQQEYWLYAGPDEQTTLHIEAMSPPAQQRLAAQGAEATMAWLGERQLYQRLKLLYTPHIQIVSREGNNGVVLLG